MDTFIKKHLFAAISIIFISGFITIAYYAGYQQGTENPKTVTIAGVSNLNEGNNKSVDFSLFWDAWNTLKEKYVNSSDLNNQDLIYGAVSGMYAATGDPYTVFMPPTEAVGFNQEISGQFGGIGAELGIKQNQLVIIAPLKNTPAEKAGLMSGDIILKIDDKITDSMTTDEAVKYIRGNKGTVITLTIFRDGWSEPKNFAIVRDIIEIPTLDWKMVNESGKEDPNGKILYIQLYNFYEQSPLLFYQMGLQALYKNPKGIIFDVRNNPGGYLDAAINITSWFVNNNSLVVSEKFQSGETQPFNALNIGVFKNIPIVVLINQGSASASEILAGALKDDRNAKLVGVKSFGKGSVQEVNQLNDNKSQVKITIAHWLTPNGSIIDKNGLTPDYEVKISDQDIKDGKDPQFDKAVQLISSELSN